MASPTVVSPEGITDWMNMIFLLCWALIMVWILLWIFTCGNCCGLLTKCILKPGAQFRWFRVLVICNTIVMFLTWIINFDISLQFNPRYPVLYFTNVVSWIDLVVSFIGDIYLKFPNCGRRCGGREKSSDVESPPSGDTEEEDSEGTPPSNRYKKRTSNNSKPPSHNTKAEEQGKSAHPVRESVKETEYGDGTRLSVKTTVYSDGSKKVVETRTAPNREQV